MSGVRLSVACIPFTPERLTEEIKRAATIPAADKNIAAQVSYLGIYLAHKDICARTIVVEKPYVDRHFLEEYARYYATTLNPPNPKATRIHFFKDAITDEFFQQKLNSAASGNYEMVCDELTKGYLGFTVVRPLRSAPIGRTILATFPSLGSDRYYTTPPHPYKAHLCGLKISISGVPFQQQEQAVGACATTAIWSALSQTMRLDGGRAPTPFAVTEAATKNWVKDRAFPATAGLKDEQILESLRQFEYSPLYFEPDKEPALFALAVKCYLRSKIPVILKMHYDCQSEAHAVALVGFREGPEDGITTPDISYQASPSWGNIRLRSRGLCRLYVHDDRLGPYARAVLKEDATKFTTLRYCNNNIDFTDFDKTAIVQSAMVPLYPKIRLSAHDLIGFAAWLLPTFRNIVGPSAHDDLRIDLRFCQAGDCLTALYKSTLAPERIVKATKHLILSRYVGLIKFMVGVTPVAYVICDSTDIRRDNTVEAPLLAIIPFYEEYLATLKDYAKRFNASTLVV
ncbi:hypothetical protein [uncultured Desulfuromusa sp.]|uniref:hypothetical protein n=1 Tax=uncultured Desulfuromusa sp. TaxID=219183 RepID=UPI002AA84B34|nr:hypothetical protein [uncultured Desulfuromusa sp.]